MNTILGRLVHWKEVGKQQGMMNAGQTFAVSKKASMTRAEHLREKRVAVDTLDMVEATL